jgi:Ni/Co efflux regulator RcnB
MRTYPMIVALGLGLIFAPPAAAEVGFSVRIGNGDSSVTLQGGKLIRRGVAKGGHGPWRRRGHRRSKPYGYFLPPYYRSYREERVETRPEPVAPPAPVVVAPVEPPPPPDPRGPVRLTARGSAPVAARYVVGEALPADLPHVTLDWRQFDLPEPPAGQIYARVGRDVLLISTNGRIVESVVPPG